MPSSAAASSGSNSYPPSSSVPAANGASNPSTKRSRRQRKNRSQQQRQLQETDLFSPASGRSTSSSGISASPQPPYAGARPPALISPTPLGTAASSSPASGALSNIPSPLISPFSLITQGIRKNTQGQHRNQNHRQRKGGEGVAAAQLEDSQTIPRVRIRSDASRGSGGVSGAVQAHPLPPYHAVTSVPITQPAENAWIAVTPAQPKPQAGHWTANGLSVSSQQQQHLLDSSTTPPLSNTSRQKESAKSRKRASILQLQNQQPQNQQQPHQPSQQQSAASTSALRQPHSISLSPAFAHAMNGIVKEQQQQNHLQQHGAPRHSQKQQPPSDRSSSNRSQASVVGTESNGVASIITPMISPSASSTSSAPSPSSSSPPTQTASSADVLFWQRVTKASW